MAEEYHLHSVVQDERAVPFWGIARLMPERKKGESQTCSGSESFPWKEPHIPSTPILFGKPSGTAKVKIKRVGSILFFKRGPRRERQDIL